jgi:hypothetical protein
MSEFADIGMADTCSQYWNRKALAAEAPFPVVRWWNTDGLSQ